MSSWLSFLVASLLHVVSQPPASELAARIEALGTTGRVLYVAAHPDDENTQMLAWLRGQYGYRTAYFSITRGDGGQNLIGAEQAPLLGIMRSWELLSARDIDGAEQFIGTRRDFGFSKSAEESLQIWGEDEALADLVAVIRDFRPHAIVTRFPEQGETHGHHLASARLARTAFALAADPGYVAAGRSEPWQATRLLHNVPSWNLTPEQIDPGWISVDVGGYSAAHGRSWGEIAADSRSRHRSQGFGWASRRGPQLEYITVLEGSAPVDGDLLGGIDVGWGPVSGAPSEMPALLAEAADRCRAQGPGAAVEPLSRAFALAGDIEDPALRTVTRDELAALIAASAGLVLDARTAATHVVPGGSADVSLQVLLRNDVHVELLGVSRAGLALAGAESQPGQGSPALAILVPHAPLGFEATIAIEPDAATSTHYWLDASPLPGGDVVPDVLRGAAASPPPVAVTFWLRSGDAVFSIDRPVRNVFVDPVYGERPRALEVLPALTLTPRRDVSMLRDGSGRVDVVATAHADVVANLVLEVPDGWSVEPSRAQVELSAGASQTVAFSVRAPTGAGVATASIVAEAEGRRFDQRLDRLDYPHIPIQSVLRPSTVRLAPLQIAVPALRVGEIPGPGDDVAESLSDIGLSVQPLLPAQIDPATLAGLDAVLVGIRAFNVEPGLHERLPVLLEWVSQGGVLLVQYQTNSRIGPLAGAIGPAPVTIGRGRVTDETATMRLLDPADPLWSTPNVLTGADFDGWVQERGLYFADAWDAAWSPVLALADPGEDEQLGSTLVAAHGEGRVIYTGISFFRQLPAGVPGAYRMLVNLLTPAGSAP